MNKSTEQREEERSRRNVVLALAHVVLVALILGAFIVVQMQGAQG